MYHGKYSIDRLPHAARTKLVQILFAFSALLLSLGCSKERFPKDKNMVPISGIVTIDGEPTQFVKVIFGNPEKVEAIKRKNKGVAIGPSGITDEKGAFSITTTHADDGVLPGEYTVVFEWMPPGVGDDLFEDGTPPAKDMKRFPPKLAAIHDRYASGKKENVSFKVEAGKPQKDLKFELTSR